MKIRINPRPTIKPITLIIIMVLMLFATLCFAFSDHLPKVKPKPAPINYEEILQEEELLYQLQQIQNEQENNEIQNQNNITPKEP